MEDRPAILDGVRGRGLLSQSTGKVEAHANIASRLGDQLAIQTTGAL